MCKLHLILGQKTQNQIQNANTYKYYYDSYDDEYDHDEYDY